MAESLFFCHDIIRVGDYIMKPELLSPAGDMDALKAGIYGGCDAIYMGGSRYSARAYATNFTDDDLKKSIDYAHTYGVRTYITINTLLKDRELKDAYEYAIKVWNMGADAIIIQDPGLIYLLSTYNHEIELHASTQMTVHNSLSALYYKEKGLKRIVFSRELSLEEIKEISEIAETEVFIHGALCVCYSGKCLMSSMLSSRSGNRGRCAQNCRMEYTLLDEKGESIARGYLISPKDLSTMDILSKVTDTGTASLKIEGRMKRKEYVYKTVHEYRKALNGEKGDISSVAQIFNREGFTDAFLLKNHGIDFVAKDSPKNSGILSGTVNKGAILLKTPLNTGDGLKCNDSGFIVTKIVRNGESVKSAGIGDRVTVFPKNYKEGYTLYRTSDTELLKLIEKNLNERFPKRIPMDIECTFIPGKALVLKALFNGMELEVMGDTVEESVNNPLDRERLTELLMKTGDTPFEVENVVFRDFSPGFLRVSKINEARRNLQDMAFKKLSETDRNEKPSDFENASINESDNYEKSEIRVMTLTMKDQLKAFEENETENIIPAFYPFHRSENALKKQDVRKYDEKGLEYYIRCPEILRSELSDVTGFIEGLKNVSGIITDNPALITHFKNHERIMLIGDYKLNITNSIGLKLYDDLKFFTPSVELDRNELKNLDLKDMAVVSVYGKTEMMVSEYCPIGAFRGGRKTDVPCSVPCVKEDFVLKDIKGEKFTLLTDNSCRCYIYNSKAVNNMDKIRELRAFGYISFRCDLTDETYEETTEIIKDFLLEDKTQDREFTRGHYKRGVE